MDRYNLIEPRWLWLQTTLLHIILFSDKTH